MIDLCVVSYCTKPLLVRFMESLWGGVTREDRSWRLYVADNGSTDDSVPWLEQNSELYDKIYFNENIGYARACNQLAALGDSPIVGLLNADAWLTSEDVSRVADSFAVHPEMAILGPKQRGESGWISHAGIFGTNVSPAHRGWKQHDPNDLLYRDFREAVTVSGAAYFVRRSVWDILTECPIYRSFDPDATGAFLETEFYYEESFCSYHARAHGLKVFYDGSISIGHSWHSSSPIGGFADSKWAVSQAMFRRALDVHGVEHD